MWLCVVGFGHNEWLMLTSGFSHECNGYANLANVRISNVHKILWFLMSNTSHLSNLVISIEITNHQQILPPVFA